MYRHVMKVTKEFSIIINTLEVIICFFSASMELEPTSKLKINKLF